MDGMDRPDELIKLYFSIGFSNNEILIVLAQNHHIIMSIRTLKRHCKKLGLFRRKNHSRLEEVMAFVHHELQQTGQMQGYRWLHLRAVQMGFVVQQDTIRQILKLLDPQGVNIRRASRLRRRQYNVRGPNALWHMDSYDKLKPYGIGINGCIDGFSRFVLWMEAYTTNSDPKVVAGYYIQCVTRLGGCPERMRGDRGTENGHVANMQAFLRRNYTDSFAKDSFIYGRSTGNQRIESWWGILRKESVQFWMNIFKSLQDDGHFTGDFLDKNLIQFCFLNLVQTELDEVVRTWNTHKIRTRRGQEMQGGRPVLMYTVPQMYNAEDKLKRVDFEEVAICKDECTPKGPFPCDDTIFELCVLLMEENGWDAPVDAFEAADLYTCLRTVILQNI